MGKDTPENERLSGEQKPLIFRRNQKHMEDLQKIYTLILELERMGAWDN